MRMLFDKGSEALEGLMREAERYVVLQMYGEGQCPPRLFMHGVEGKGIIHPNKLTSPDAKDQFASLARVACVAHGAEATVFVSEAWNVSARKGEPLDLTQVPSESPNRQEVVIMMGQSRESYMQKAFPILRHANGKFKGLGEPLQEMTEADKVLGRFAQFVPPEVPTEEERKQARAILEAKGILPKREERRERGRGMTM